MDIIKNKIYIKKPPERVGKFVGFLIFSNFSQIYIAVTCRSLNHQ